MSTAKKSRSEKGKELPGIVRRAKVDDLKAIQRVIQLNADQRLLLARSIADIISMFRSLWVYEENGVILGTAALELAWMDLAEVKAVSVHPDHKKRGIGDHLVRQCLLDAAEIGLSRVFCLTFVPDYFKRFGFRRVPKEVFPLKIWTECIRCPYFPDCGEVPMEYLIPGSAMDQERKAARLLKGKKKKTAKRVARGSR